MTTQIQAADTTPTRSAYESSVGFASVREFKSLVTSAKRGAEISEMSIGFVWKTAFASAIDRARPTAVTAPDLLKFILLRGQWHKERGATSSITKMAMCPSYQRIIGMGDKVIPLILCQLENEGDEPDMWFWALAVLTGENPIRPEDRGNMKKMADVWLDWAASVGYAW